MAGETERERERHSTSPLENNTDSGREREGERVREEKREEKEESALFYIIVRNGGREKVEERNTSKEKKGGCPRKYVNNPQEKRIDMQWKQILR